MKNNKVTIFIYDSQREKTKQINRETIKTSAAMGCK